jgi:signal transduction histidine kinase/ATP/maltotriose-dependent transcriptional regulator MalT
MTVKVIARKIREPELPYLHIPRQAVRNSVQSAVQQNKKCIYLSGITGYGKTIAVADFLQSFPKASRFWYSLDEWDKDPVTFLSYLYQMFLNQKLVSEELNDLFSQPLNTEKHIKNFVGLFSNELEANLTEQSFLILDNFQEVQDEEVIRQILAFMLNYCPEKLKILFLSRQNYPDSFYPYIMKHEMAEIGFKELMLSQEEGDELIRVLGKSNTELCGPILNISQKNISLFILLAQNFQDKASLEKYYENKLLKSALTEVTAQIYDSFSADLKDFINEILFLPRINREILGQIFRDDYSYQLNILAENGLLLLNQEENGYSLNPSFIPVLTDNFFNLPESDRDKILEKIMDILKDNPEDLNFILFKAKAFNRVMENLKKNYEHYFIKYLYSTLEQILEPLKKLYPDDIFINFLQIRLLRHTGNVNKALELIEKVPPAQKSAQVILEEGACLAMTGRYASSIEKLAPLEKENTDADIFSESRGSLNISDYITLINVLGISYLNVHELDLALNYLHKAVNLKDRLAYRHDLLKIYNNLGLAYTWLGDFRQATSAYEQSISLARELKILPLALTFNNLAVIHNMQGDYNKAYQNCIDGLEVLEKINNDPYRLTIYLTLSDTYIGLKNEYKTNESLEYVDAFLKKNPNPIQSALLYRQKAREAIEENQPEKAREFIMTAMNTRKLSEGDSSYVEYKLETGIIDYYAGYYQEALDELAPIEENLTMSKHQYHLARFFLYKALIFNRLNDKKNFEKYHKQAANLIKENQYALLATKLDLKIETVVVQEKEEPLKIYTFRRQPEVTHGDNEISKKDWGGNQAKLILLCLLLNKEGVAKDKLFDIIFPLGDKSRSALHAILNKLKAALDSVYGDTEIIQYSDNVYRFNFSIDYWWDTGQFEYYLGEALQQDDPVQKAEKTAQALYLYKSDLAQGFEMESWISASREHYRKLARKNFEELAFYYLEEKQFDELLNISDHFFRLDNCYEAACKYKIIALFSLDRRKDALKQYTILEKALQKEFNDVPSPELKLFKTRLFQKPVANEQEEAERIAALFKSHEELQKEIRDREKAMVELKQAQVQMVHSEKMSGLETLVAGVAHEINNPTNFVHGITHNLENEIKDLKSFIFELAGEEADEKFIQLFESRFQKISSSLSDITDGSERIKTIVEDLRNFSRLDEAEHKTVDVTEGISSSLRLIQSKYSKQVEFITDLQVHIKMDCLPAQLNQAFMNILVNACEAILAKQQKNGDSTPGRVDIKAFKAENELIIEFSDNGIGMTAATKKKIFEPFFTTKEVGSGTGMGMSITYSIIEKHHGKIEIDSEAGKGTKVTLILPITHR